jgi:hypothetical protein
MLGRPIAHDRPRNQRASRDCANRSSEVGRVTGREFACLDGLVEESFVSGMQATRILDRESVEIGIADVELKEGQAVRQFLRRFHLPCHLGCGSHQGRQRRLVSRPHIGKAGIDAVYPQFHQCQ